MFLRSVTLLRDGERDFDRYPLSIPAIRSLHTLPITAPVTFFAGENGSGKSTLLEAIAWQCGFNTAGGARHHTHAVEASEAALGPHIRLSWLPKVTSGFFLRAETFWHFASYLDRLAAEDPSFDYGGYGGRSLHEQSHGESFLSLFLNRLDGRIRSLYLLDEPESALSPARQLAFLRILHRHAASGRAQFIIATHSPILLGFPGALIYSFDGGEIRKVDYGETEHYQITKGFLNRPDLYLKELLREEDGEED